MLISFIICTYNRDKYIYQCLSCLASNVTDAEWELVFVNNNSTDNTQAEYERFQADFPASHSSCYLETQQGLSYARNRGIREAHGDWFVFLDDDAMVDTDYIQNLSTQLTQHPEVGAFGGQIKPFFEESEPGWLSKWSMGFVSALDMGRKVVLFKPTQFPIGANMGISRRAIEQVGVFNTQLGRRKNLLLGGEEKDLFLRIHAAQIPILYFPNIPVHHCIPPHRTTKEFIQRLGYGVGVSERMRTLSVSRWNYRNRLFSELIKWGGTVVLLCGFYLKGQPAKGNILVTFRINVTRGLMTRFE